MTASLGPVSRPPRVTIGLPVHNGERYVAEALDALLAQTFRDFELIISDNASTDRTPEICRACAARDPRIRYERLEANIGGFRNHNRLVASARGEYFTWAAHDDLWNPEHLIRCVEALDRAPGAVLAFTRIRYVDANGRELPIRTVPPDMSSRDPVQRWTHALLIEAIFDAQHGVMRTSVIRRTHLFPLHRDADCVFLGELALLGPFCLVDEPLFTKRMHSGQSGARYPTPNEYNAWCDPEGPPRRSFSSFATLQGHATNLWHSHLSLGVRLSCLPALARWVFTNQYGLRHDLGLTAAQWSHRTAPRQSAADHGMERS